MVYNFSMENLEKDKVMSIRINKRVYEKLKELGITPQKIIDSYVSNTKVYKLELEAKKKEQKKKLRGA